MELAELPVNVQISNPIADYSLVYKQKPGKLVLNRKFMFKKDNIGVEEIKDFQLLYRKIIAADNKQIALKQSAGNADSGLKKKGKSK
jgi:hypothetical protein